ncbi:MAG TPA: helix-turn-helix transcriptional regulator [Chitinophagaceae bacterium]|nr:helix-turn-helix transcriptional regulator [Chitinophagaceae bacterium]
MFRHPATRLVLLVLFVLQTTATSFSQTSSFPYNEWVKKLGAPGDSTHKDVDSLISFFLGWKRDLAFSALDQLAKQGGSAGPRFQVRFNMLKAITVWNWRNAATKDSVLEKVIQIMKLVMNQAYEINDDWLIGNASYWYARMMLSFQKIEPAAMYGLNAAEIFDRKGEKDPLKYQLLGGIFYNIREYQKSLQYIRRSIENEKENPKSRKAAVISRWNTVALCFQKMEMYDSAFYYYDKAMQLANADSNEVWKGIISGNKGQVYYLQKNYDVAKPLLEYDYRASKQYKEYYNAANSLQWVARISLIEGKKDSALLQVKEAMQLLKSQPTRGAPYFGNLYYATADVYRALGNNDSFYHYSQLYNQLHDSTERAVASSRLEISRLRLDNQENVSRIRELQKEKQAEAEQRNFFLAGIILLATIALLIVNRKRLKTKYQHQLILQQKAVAEKEVASAKEQLNMFTQNMIEKTNLIEQLEQELNERTSSHEHARLVQELSRQTILTEEDWVKFKLLFEKMYPGFFLNLKEKITDITLAEQRMAALTRLHFSSKQIASILGISLNSVHKAKQRLRQRFNLQSEASIEEFITKI